MVTLAEVVQTIAEGQRLTGRECRECSQCCKAMAVVELAKLSNTVCAHCNANAPNGCCRIYLQRPPSCQAYACMWLISNSWGPHWWPHTSHIIINAEHSPERGSQIRFVVDPEYPDCWQLHPFIDDISKCALHGLGEGNYTTFVIIGSKALRIEGG